MSDFNNLEDTLAVIEEEFPNFSWLVRRITEAEVVRSREFALSEGFVFAGPFKPGYFAHIHGEDYEIGQPPSPSFKAEAETAEAALFGALTQAREARDVKEAIDAG